MVKQAFGDGVVSAANPAAGGDIQVDSVSPEIRRAFEINRDVNQEHARG